MRSRSKPNEIEELLTVAEVARIDRTTPKTVRRWIDEGKLGAYRLGGQFRISRKDHELFLRERWTG